MVGTANSTLARASPTACTRPAAEYPQLPDGHAESADDHVELAMTEEALTGFLAWLEASPPGSHLQDIA